MPRPKKNQSKPTTSSTNNNVELRIKAPHPTQKQILSSLNRFNVICCGRRWGKTVLGMRAVLDLMFQGYPCAWAVPEHEQARVVFDELANLFAPLKPRVNASDKIIELPPNMGNGSLKIYSLQNAENIRGKAYRMFIIDEAAHAPDLESQWHNIIAYTLADYTDSQAIFMSTPNGKNFFHQLFLNGQDPLKPQWSSWQATSYDNPHVPPEFFLMQKENTPEITYRQEVLAEFIEDVNSVFHNVRTLCRLKPQEKPIPDHEYVFGIDLGQSIDFTVIAIFDKTTNELADMKRFGNKMSWQLQLAHIQNLVERYKPKTMMVEKNNVGSVICEAMHQHHWPIQEFTTSASSKPELIHALIMAMEKESITLLNDKILIGELLQFKATKMPSGYTKYSAPDGQHDDCVIALALAWQLAKPNNRNERFLHLLNSVDRRSLGV